MLRTEAGHITQACRAAKTVLTSGAAFDMTNVMSDAPKIPSPSSRQAKAKVRPRSGPKTREDKLAAALRANLRRRKAPRAETVEELPDTEKPQDPS